ncbi:hypothetical protein EJB05_55440, partial [Eragrostis curvula]
MALSPRTLLAKNRFLCEVVSHKGFDRDQNLPPRSQSAVAVQRQGGAGACVPVSLEPSCVRHHHDPSCAFGDLAGIRKHFRCEHGQKKKWKCDACNKRYAAQSDCMGGALQDRVPLRLRRSLLQVVHDATVTETIIVT